MQDEMRDEYDLTGGVRGKYYKRYEEALMGRTIDWDTIPDSSLLPSGLYTLEVDDLAETTTKVKDDGTGGYLMYKATFRVAEPASFAGTQLFDYFVIGNEDDPAGDKSETWTSSIGGGRMKRLFKATLVPLTGDVDKNIEACKGQRFVASVSEETEQKEGPYKGTKRNRINRMYAIGTQPVDISRSNGTSRPIAGASSGPSVATVASTVPCPYCGDSVTRTTYSAHVKSQHPEEA